eukprot:1152872-Pelagomonas_calceolata.AAC.3
MAVLRVTKKSTLQSTLQNTMLCFGVGRPGLGGTPAWEWAMAVLSITNKNTVKKQLAKHLAKHPEKQLVAQEAPLPAAL